MRARLRVCARRVVESSRAPFPLTADAQQAVHWRYLVRDLRGCGTGACSAARGTHAHAAAYIRSHFSAWGPLVDAVVLSDRLTNRPRGFAFVQFADAEVAGRVASGARQPAVSSGWSACLLGSPLLRAPGAPGLTRLTRAQRCTS